MVSACGCPGMLCNDVLVVHILVHHVKLIDAVFSVITQWHKHHDVWGGTWWHVIDTDLGKLHTLHVVLEHQPPKHCWNFYMGQSFTFCHLLALILLCPPGVSAEDKKA